MKVAPLESHRDDTQVDVDSSAPFENVDEEEVNVGRPMRKMRAGKALFLPAALLVLLAVWPVARAGIAEAGRQRALNSNAGRPQGAPAIVFLMVQASGGQAYRAGIQSGATGTVQLGDRERLLLSPILGGDTVTVRIEAVDANGGSAAVGTVDLKSGARARLNYPFLFEIEWLPTAAGAAAARH